MIFQLKSWFKVKTLKKKEINSFYFCCGSFRNSSLNFNIITEQEEEREEMTELSAAPTAKRPCQCCCQTYSEILSFLEKRSEAEQRLREEELALRREELEIQRSTIFAMVLVISAGFVIGFMLLVISVAVFSIPLSMSSCLVNLYSSVLFIYLIFAWLPLISSTCALIVPISYFQ